MFFDQLFLNNKPTSLPMIIHMYMLLIDCVSIEEKSRQTAEPEQSFYFLVILFLEMIIMNYFSQLSNKS